MLNENIIKAYDIVYKNNQPLPKEIALELAKLEGSDILDLMSLAHKVRVKYAQDEHICTIHNAKSGACSQNCSYCAQSSFFKTAIEVYPFQDFDIIASAAEKTLNNGVNIFGLVTQGYGYKKINREFQQILDTIDKLYEKFPNLQVCGSFGILSEETAKALADHKVVHYNHNLQVNPPKYKELIATTHTIEERIETVKLVKKYGIQACCGGIFGLGETMEDRVELAYALRELDVEIIPLNVLIPIEGTAVENVEPIPAAEVAKSFAITRLVNPTKAIKFAAGRETRMKDFQGLLMLAGANGFLTGGYLTTRGRETSEDKKLMEEIELFC
ncbi:MAG TPA: biotin synthase BioB [Ignavibacteriales bacterium]|nr:biotin synthase BioB [Ignavibacteriales bacterium]HOL81434.1 biotin synthase BioB [Ignavibacteriales bacterium]HOM65332.1 biotin synthase BioB [Ignavibacteriales bacterium]HPP33639.1 biotin synthase BioB [Ignavibacteriales bacterium]HRT98379.1 biotin synthase BioB [Ignavibacteriales bacterium]